MTPAAEDGAALFKNAGLAGALLGSGAAAEQAPQTPPSGQSVWTYAGKTGVGTLYEAYVTNGGYADDGPTGPISRVWFSLADGIVTETAHGLIHEAQIQDLQFLVTGNGFFDEEKRDTVHRIGYLHTDPAGRPLSLAYRVIKERRSRDSGNTVLSKEFPGGEGNRSETMADGEREEAGIIRLPTSLDEALDALAEDESARSWFPEALLDVYLRHKRAEIQIMAELDRAERCRLYSQAY